MKRDHIFSVEDINTFHKHNTLNFIIFSLISSDNLVTKEDYDFSLNNLRKILITIPQCDIPQDEKLQYTQFALDSIDLLEKEINDLKLT